MRVRTRDFASRPSQELIQAFETAHDSAVRTFGIIEAAVDAPTRQKFAPLKGQLEEIAAQFDDLARNQKILGFTESEGIRDRMTKAAAAVERIIHEDMSWLSESDAHKLLISLLTMRRYEAEYRLTRSTLMQTVFFDEFKKFKTDRGRRRRRRRAEAAAGAAGKAYSDTFAQWIEFTDKVAPPVAVIEFNVKNMMPVADEIIASAKVHTNAAAAALTASQQRTRNIIIGVGLAAVLIGLGFSWLIGRSITRPLNGLADVMKRLADGDMSAKNSRHPRVRRDRRDGADRDRVPRQHDRARPADRGPDQVRAREGAAQRKRRGRHRGVPRLDPAGARQPARRGATARNVLGQAQQRGRRGDRGSRAPPRAASAPPRRTSPPRPARSRNSRPRSARSRARPRNRPRSRPAPSPRRGAPPRP